MDGRTSELQVRLQRTGWWFISRLFWSVTLDSDFYNLFAGSGCRKLKIENEVYVKLFCHELFISNFPACSDFNVLDKYMECESRGSRKTMSQRERRNFVFFTFGLNRLLMHKSWNNFISTILNADFHIRKRKFLNSIVWETPSTDDSVRWKLKEKFVYSRPKLYFSI